MNYLPGCFTVIVDWHGAREVAEPPKTPLVTDGDPVEIIRRLWIEKKTDRAGCALKAMRMLARNGVHTFEKLAAMTSDDLSYQDKYGPMSHRWLTEWAKGHGVDIPPLV